MDIISRVSKGSKMDQIYVPKNRAGIPIGSYVMITPIEKKTQIKPFYYNIKDLETIKIEIINRIFQSIEADNVIITGSFLNKGFKFNDIDILIISENKINITYIKKTLRDLIGAEFHLILITPSALLKGLAIDPLYKHMLRKFVSKKRVIYNIKTVFNYKLLDLHLLKSQTLIDNFDVLTGDEKYQLTRNLVVIRQFIEKKEISDSMINSYFGKNTIEQLKNNTIKKDFLQKYKKIFHDTKIKILDGIENESKQIN